jgi:hypothetical protein
MNLGQTIVDFEADTTLGKTKFHEYLGNCWVSLEIVFDFDIHSRTEQLS